MRRRSGLPAATGLACDLRGLHRDHGNEAFVFLGEAAFVLFAHPEGLLAAHVVFGERTVPDLANDALGGLGIRGVLDVGDREVLCEQDGERELAVRCAQLAAIAQ